MTLKYIWRSFQPRLSFPRSFQQSLACFRVARSPSNSWASCFFHALSGYDMVSTFHHSMELGREQHVLFGPVCLVPTVTEIFARLSRPQSQVFRDDLEQIERYVVEKGSLSSRAHPGTVTYYRKPCNEVPEPDLWGWEKVADGTALIPCWTTLQRRLKVVRSCWNVV